MTYSNIENLKNEFSELTIKYLKNADLEYRKKVGQYFTPKTVREKLLSKIPKSIINPRVIDPACGTGEFLTSANSYFDNPEIYGLDIDNDLVNLVKNNYSFAKVAQADSLKKQYINKYDVVIGNPPYFEFQPESEIKNKFASVIGGRPNIFSLFIKLGIDLLKDGGYLAFVVPPSMNNGAYFSKLRRYIINNTNIEYLEILKDSKLFHSAQQTTMLIVLKKGKNKGDYLFTRNGTTIFTENPNSLKQLFEGKTCLREYGFRVKTGKLVWNQHRESLTDTPEGAIRLIWSHNITENGLDLTPKKSKKPYVKSQLSDIGPAIVANRIVGSVNKGSLKAALIDPAMRFLGENHVNVIYDTVEKTEKRLSWLLEQLKNKENLKCLQQITGNTQLSKTELENLFPIDQCCPLVMSSEHTRSEFGSQLAII